MTLTSADGGRSIQTRAGDDLAMVTEDGKTSYVHVAPASKHQGWSLWESMIDNARSAAGSLIWAGTADGELPMEEAARLLAEQVAGNYCGLPDWAGYRPEDMRVSSTNVFDAYYGDPVHFCCNMMFCVSLAENDLDGMARGYWEVGSGLGEPISEGEYSGYYDWGREVLVRKNEDGDWYCSDWGTGGYSVNLPYSMSHSGADSIEYAPLEGLVEQLTLTEGFTHDWILPLYIIEKPKDTLEELNAILDGYDQGNVKTICQALAAYLRDEKYIHFGGMMLEDLRELLAPAYQEYLA